ncbi:type II toxin-antitoxin system Phd/YefM family antitoxin [Saccharothrix variisporea]|uniref:type II toxin-antitoxin system Phd/YefM family antitoxin n=1 Tax=Saccharothrix variisporea TaxID=543527 RepID=UPI001476DAC2|nr:type II toxin-antitoxin system prevent-host-death family antitoxin [Saccharothrix variisporea]
MESITVTEFRRNPEAYVLRAAAGEKIGITRWGKPAAMLTPPSPEDAVCDRFVLSGELVPATAPWRVLLDAPEDFEAHD